MFYAPFGKGKKAVGGAPAAGAHKDAPHGGKIPLGPYTYIPIVHTGPSLAGPAHIDAPHAAKGPFIHGGPEGGEAPFYGKGYGKAGKGYGKPVGYGKGALGKPFGYQVPVVYGR